MQFTEAELTAAVAGAARMTLAAQTKEIRRGKVDVDQVWHDLGAYGRYQLLDPIGAQVLPVLGSLPDVPRTHGEPLRFTAAQVRDAVAEHVGDQGGRVRRKATELAVTALVNAALAALPPWTDPERFDPDELQVPDSLEGLDT